MLSVERQRLVLHHLRTNGTGNVSDLAQALGVSSSTVRRDLTELSERGLLTRVRGGASVEPAATTESTRARRAAENADQKRRIGAAAAAMVVDGETVLISGGTTTEAMLPFLADRENLTVLTNGLNVAAGLAAFTGVSTVVLGGVVRAEEMSLLGTIAEHTLAQFNVDTAFCGAFGIDPAGGISGAHPLEASTDRSLLAGAGRLVVLADATKFTQRGPVRLAPAESIDCVVTDRDAPHDAVVGLQARGVDVVCV